MLEALKNLLAAPDEPDVIKQHLENYLKEIRLAHDFQMATVKEQMTMQIIERITTRLGSTDNPMTWLAMERLLDSWLRSL